MTLAHVVDTSVACVEVNVGVRLPALMTNEPIDPPLNDN